MHVEWTLHPDAEIMAQQLAGLIESRIRQALAQRGKALLALCGGSTPRQAYQRLNACELNWANIAVVLTDERNVPPNHADSNQRLLRETLFSGPAQAAQLLPLDDATVAALPSFDLVLLGMGEDGHTASLFPGVAGLREAMDAGSRIAVAPLTPATAPHARTSLTLARLVRTHATLLAISGDAKRAVLQTALYQGDALQPPIRGVLQAMPCPISIHWCP